jgi:seryl-tRNA synthetase
VAEFRPATPDQEELRRKVIDAGLLIDTGVLGVYGRGRDFEAIRRAVNDVVSRAAEPDGAEPVRFPPVLPRHQFEKSGYLSSFPHLAGTIFDFEGDEDAARVQNERATAHEDWSEFQTMSDLVLTPAACYPVCPAIAARGPLQPGGIVVDAGDSYVFRSEPSGDPARLQMFHQREIVRIGEPDAVAEWRNTWRDRALELLRGLGLAADYDVASDPFFGRSGRMLAASQRQQELKFEIQVQIAGPEPTAVASFNYHQLHFAETYGIELANGETAHTACLGFGLERITLALLNTHGLDPGAWPADVRAKLFEA